jgi:hypothetical protein
MQLEIVKLPLGQQAPVDADCIRIEEQSHGSYKLTGSAMCVGADDGESVSLVGGLMFESTEEAEATGLAWAANVGVECLLVSTGTLAHPLELTEIDHPL